MRGSGRFGVAQSVGRGNLSSQCECSLSRCIGFGWCVLASSLASVQPSMYYLEAIVARAPCRLRRSLSELSFAHCSGRSPTPASRLAGGGMCVMEDLHACAKALYRTFHRSAHDCGEGAGFPRKGSALASGPERWPPRLVIVNVVVLVPGGAMLPSVEASPGRCARSHVIGGGNLLAGGAVSNSSPSYGCHLFSLLRLCGVGLGAVVVWAFCTWFSLRCAMAMLGWVGRRARIDW